jgi:crotonobetainyl-CoA:carnitine CoA-transferase CaiB-like acyl-CoA transferase
MPGALDGVKVLEFSEIIAAPFAGMHLADMGADIIKVEPPAGEPWRLPAAFAPGENRAFISLNRGKRGLALDLKTPEARDVIYKLVPSMDVVIVNYRPDTPRALGIDYETLRALNPRLIYVSMTAFGSRGPHAHRPGYDIVAQAMTGLMATDNKLGETGLPIPAAPAVVDFATGISICGAVCAALYARERTGEGQLVETSLMATALAMQTGQFMQMEATESAPLREATRRIREARARRAPWSEIVALQGETPRLVAPSYYRCYETSDGVIAIAALSPALHRKLADAVGVEDRRLDNPGMELEEQRAAGFEFMALMEVALREKSTAEWADVLDKAGVPAGEFKMVFELHSDPQVVENGLIVDLDHPVAGHLRMSGPLYKMSKTPSAVSVPSPTVGQHNDEILTSLGYSEMDIASLREKGVIR